MSESPTVTTSLLASPSGYRFRDRDLLEPWENPGSGTTTRVPLPKHENGAEAAGGEKHHHAEVKLGQLTATAICGNDLLSSCLYTAGVCATAAGVYAAIPLALVVFMLYFFRFVYG